MKGTIFSFNLSGARLTAFHVDGKDVVEFRPTGMTITAPLLQELVLKRVASLVGGLDLSILLKQDQPTNQTDLLKK